LLSHISSRFSFVNCLCALPAVRLRDSLTADNNILAVATDPLFAIGGYPSAALTRHDLSGFKASRRPVLSQAPHPYSPIRIRPR
jgi:hypothetical protein